jgi:hypothetical protein
MPGARVKSVPATLLAPLTAWLHTPTQAADVGKTVCIARKKFL